MQKTGFRARVSRIRLAWKSIICMQALIWVSCREDACRHPLLSPLVGKWIRLESAEGGRRHFFITFTDSVVEARRGTEPCWYFGEWGFGSVTYRSRYQINGNRTIKLEDDPKAIHKAVQLDPWVPGLCSVEVYIRGDTLSYSRVNEDGITYLIKANHNDSRD